MTAADVTAWTAAFQAGHRKGLADGAAETVGRNHRDPDHAGTQPDSDPEWLDGFLEGYGHGWREAVGGAR